MSNCDQIDPLVTPYIDGELAAHDCARVEQHLQACEPCRMRVTAERSVCHLLRRSKAELHRARVPQSLRQAVQAGRPAPPVVRFPAATAAAAVGARRAWRDRRLAVAAMFLLVVGGAVAYRATVGATRAMAAELTADHMKCFMVNNVLHTHESVAEVEAYLRSGFDWQATLPEHEPAPAPAPHEDLEVVGARPCFYEHGKVAHIMYRHRGLPVSIFMLPGVEYERNLVHTLGHDAVIWADAGRTFVLIAKAPRADVEKIATMVQASLR